MNQTNTRSPQKGKVRRCALSGTAGMLLCGLTRCPRSCVSSRVCRGDFRGTDTSLSQGILGFRTTREPSTRRLGKCWTTGSKASRSRRRPTAQVRLRCHSRCLGRGMLTLSFTRAALAGFGLGESARTEDKKSRGKNATFGVFERLYAEAYKEPNFAEKKWESTVKSKIIGPQWRPSDGGKSRVTGGGASGEPRAACRVLQPSCVCCSCLPLD